MGGWVGGTARCSADGLLRYLVVAEVVGYLRVAEVVGLRPLTRAAGAWQASAAGCSLWKQSPPSLLDSLIKMFMEIGRSPHCLLRLRQSPTLCPLYVFSPLSPPSNCSLVTFLSLIRACPLPLQRYSPSP